MKLFKFNIDTNVKHTKLFEIKTLLELLSREIESARTEFNAIKDDLKTQLEKDSLVLGKLKTRVGRIELSLQNACQGEIDKYDSSGNVCIRNFKRSLTRICQDQIILAEALRFEINKFNTKNQPQ